MSQAAEIAPNTPPLAGPPAGWLSADKAAQVLGQTCRHVRRKCEAGALAARLVETRWGARWYVDPAALPVLHLAAPPEAVPARPDPLAPYASLSEAKREGLRARLAAVEGAREALAARRPGLGLTAARAGFVAAWNALGHAPQLTERTLLRWLRNYEKAGVEGLLDERRWHGVFSWSGQAMEYIEGEYLREGAQALAAIYERAEWLARDEGWRLPTYRHVCRLMKKLEPALAAAGRDPARFRSRMLPTAERDWSRVPAMGCWVADHRQFDVLLPREVEDARGRKAWRWYRPWLTLYLDARSWYPAAWEIAWDGPDAQRTLATFIRGVRAHGRPGHVYLDNGKDFRALRFSGGRPHLAPKATSRLPERHVQSVLEILSIGVTFALPFNARAKVVEPFFRLVADRFDKTWQTYCGNKTERKPEFVKTLLSSARAKRPDEWAVAGYDLERFAAAFDAWVTGDYGLRESPSSAAKPLSALRAFEDLRAADFRATRPADEDLAMLLLPSKAVSVQPNGLWVPAHGRFYWSDDLQDRAGASGRDRARRVTYRFDPLDASRIWVFDAESGKFLAEARPYIGSGMHPLAPQGSPEAERVGALMALRRGREKHLAAEVRSRRQAADGWNLRLAAQANAAAALGRHDPGPVSRDPEGSAPPSSAEPAAPEVLVLTPLSAAAQARRSSDARAHAAPARGPSAADLMQSRDAAARDVEAGPSAAEILAGNPHSAICNPQSKGGGRSALDILVERPLGGGPQETDHDRDERTHGGGSTG